MVTQITLLCLVCGLFCGHSCCNFPHVVTITMTLGVDEAAVRSSLLMRDDTKMIVITNRKNTQVEDAEQHFNVIELPDINEV